MRGYYPQSHVRNEKPYISTFARPIAIKIGRGTGRGMDYDKEPPTTKSNVLGSRDQV